jgi:hypothetical protein
VAPRRDFRPTSRHLFQFKIFAKLSLTVTAPISYQLRPIAWISIPGEGMVPFRRGINKEVRRYMRSVAAVYGFGLTIKPSLVLPDPL